MEPDYIEATQTSNGVCAYGADPVFAIITEFLGADVRTCTSNDVFQSITSNGDISLGYLDGVKAVRLRNGKFIVAKS